MDSTQIRWGVPRENIERFSKRKDWECPGCGKLGFMYWWKSKDRPVDASWHDLFVQDFCSPECAVAWELRGKK